MKNVLVVHGPNLNLLGTREPEIYGSTSLAELEHQIAGWAAELDLECSFFQSNHEGALIDTIHDARGSVDAVLINAGALTHYSYALYDALAAVDKVTVEVHISNIHAREPWRHNSVTAVAADHIIYGRGLRGYQDGLRRIVASGTSPYQRFTYGADTSQYGELRVPQGDGPHPVAVLLHGGFWHDVWTLDLMDGIAIDLVERGWAAWNVEYRRVGAGGGWPTTMNDVAAAFEFVASIADDQNLDLARLAAVGHSAGGQLALWSAGRAGATVIPQQVVALAPVTDMADAFDRDLDAGAVERFLGRSPVTDPERYAATSPVSLLPLGCRQLLVHGAADDRVPLTPSLAYFETARAAGDDVTLHATEDTDHFVVIDPRSSEWQAAAEWLAD
ncbi:MAG: type II 3-dehydroquinate dehydratase [bacterium]|nr:type II 3-dehydroquinate dehydratase [bacterium]